MKDPAGNVDKVLGQEVSMRFANEEAILAVAEVLKNMGIEWQSDELKFLNRVDRVTLESDSGQEIHGTQASHRSIPVTKNEEHIRGTASASCSADGKKYRATISMLMRPLPCCEKIGHAALDKSRTWKTFSARNSLADDIQSWFRKSEPEDISATVGLSSMKSCNRFVQLNGVDRFGEMSNDDGTKIDVNTEWTVRLEEES